VLSGMFEGIEYRGYGQAIVEELAKYASVPVWNGLTNEYHPTQILADFLTLREHFGKLQGLKFAYMGDARYNMGNSLMIGCAKMGLHFVACAPKAYWPDPALVEKCKEFARVSGGVPLWYGYSLAQVTDGAATVGGKAEALGVKNLVVEVPAKQTMDEAARNALSDALAASGVEHTVFWDDAAGLFR